MHIAQITNVQIGESLFGKLSGEGKRGSVLISHGAGGNMEAPLLRRTAEELNRAGFLTLRWNYSYVQAGRAPSAGGKREIPEMEAALKFLQNQAPGSQSILIGKSFGGRIATYFGTHRNDISGYVFYGLPIQGAGKNAKPRDWTHLSALKGKALFVTGDKDKLCPLDYLAEVQQHLSIPFESKVVSGDHSFKPRGEDAALQHCIEWIGKSFSAFSE